MLEVQFMRLLSSGDRGYGFLDWRISGYTIGVWLEDMLIVYIGDSGTLGRGTST